MRMKDVAWAVLLSQVVLCGFVAGGLLEQDPLLVKLLQVPDIRNTARFGFEYSIDQMRNIAANYNQGDYPRFDSFNNDSIRYQIRKNMLAICDQMLILSSNGYEPAPGRIADIKTIQSIYLNDEVFNTRRIPKYYHATTSITHVDQILETKRIKALPAVHYGAWTASCFYYTQWIFAFSSDLELPISEISKDSYYMGPCWALGRLHDIVFFNGSSIELVAWAVPAEQMNETLEYIQTLDKSTASYYSKIGLTNDQMILERHLITLAQIYSSDRANAFITHALSVNTPLYSLGANCSLGEVVVFDDPANGFKPAYGICTNNTDQDMIAVLNYDGIKRSNKISSVARTTVKTTNMLVMDLSAVNDAMKMVQQITDGLLVTKA